MSTLVRRAGRGVRHDGDIAHGPFARAPFGAVTGERGAA